jgi:hypothetical protein
MKLFATHKGDGWLWFRIFGCGLYIKNIKKVRAYFSERNGLKKYWQIGNYRIFYLKPTTP